MRKSIAIMCLRSYNATASFLYIKPDTGCVYPMHSLPIRIPVIPAVIPVIIIIPVVIPIVIVQVII